jgi:hypothetical protein
MRTLVIKSLPVRASVLCEAAAAALQAWRQSRKFSKPGQAYASGLRETLPDAVNEPRPMLTRGILRTRHKLALAALAGAALGATAVRDPEDGASLRALRGRASGGLCG